MLSTLKLCPSDSFQRRSDPFSTFSKLHFSLFFFLNPDKPTMQEVEPELIQQVAASGRLVVDSSEACGGSNGSAT